MLRTVECEAAVFGCATVEAQPTQKGGAPDPDCLLPAPGADHLLSRIPTERWGVIVAATLDQATSHLKSAELPLPGSVVSSPEVKPDDYVRAAEELGADPLFCLAIEDHPRGVDAALTAGLKVIGVATNHPASELGAADMVIPSLYSLHVVGLHPVLVLEVDALPDIGTFIPGQTNRR